MNKVLDNSNWKNLLLNELKLKGYSKKTIGAYVFQVGKVHKKACNIPHIKA